MSEVNNQNINKTRKAVGNDAFHRINFLYQVNKYIVDKHPALASYYGNLMVAIAKKNVLKIHPDIKRQVCKRCHCILIDKKSAKMKIKKLKKEQYIEWTCHICLAKKTFLSDKNKDHKIWVQKPDGVVETIK